MKICIWCCKDENLESFNRKAHTVPKALEGQHLCENVCDRCNSFFGNPQKGLFSIETALKEGLNLSKYRLLNTIPNLPSKHQANKYKSSLFNLSYRNGKYEVKPKQLYSLKPNFQQMITRQFKRGLYKVFLEETERQVGGALDSKYDFIREFARYNLNDDLPVIHFERRFGALLTAVSWIKHPEVFLENVSEDPMLLNEYGFIEFELLGHVFGLTSSRLWRLNFDQYIRKSMHKKSNLFNGYRIVEYFDDLDLTLNRVFVN